METRGLRDLYLPKSIAAHVKIILLCAVFTPLWGLFINAKLTNDFLLGTFLIMVVDIETIGFLAVKIFDARGNYTRKEVTRIFLTRMLLFLFSALFICTIVFALYVIILHLVKGWGFPDLFGIDMVHTIKSVVKVTAIGISCSIPVMFYSNWQEALKREYKLIEQNLIFQNESLKNQMNPHFLFNSFNTLSSLINTQPEIAEIFVNRLSSIYRYILENSMKDKVSLQSELGFINDYFFLHKTRDDDKIQLHIDVKNADSYSILPVSLQLLIENAIKHNMATRQNPLNIDIYIDGAYIVVKNNLQRMATQLQSTKIGLKNLKERIRLITEKDLVIEITSNEYIVKVPLLQ